MVLAATNRPADLDEAVLRRFAVQCEVPLPDAVCREAILRLTLARHVGEAGADAVERVLRDNRAPAGLAGSGERPLEHIARLTSGFSGSDLFELCAAAAGRPVHEHMRAAQGGRGGGRGRARVGRDTFVDASEGPRKLELTDFTEVLKTMKPSGVQAHAYRAPRR
jgi:SpoVK/Ycf46/Vps4 family AAA+-type ATPase